MRRITLSIVFAAIFIIALTNFAWADHQSSIQVRTAANGIKYLTDSKGMTLYYYTKDTDGQSACYGKCANAWPVFYTPSITVPSGVNAADFGTVTRNDGTKQTTYKGWPLYYWFQDKRPGEMKGEGFKNVWYIIEAPAYTVMIATNDKLGNYLVDGNGNSLYYFKKDSPGKSACEGQCIKNWPAFTADRVIAPSSLDPSDFSTITRADGMRQVTYKGYPLYYWAKDQKRGQVTGEGFGNVWYVIDPAKFPSM
jgi:predicted lipoprotein with Yx(FWY)xxD motif